MLELPATEGECVRRRTIKTEMVVGLAASGKEIALADGYERTADAQLRKDAAELFQTVQGYLDRGEFCPHPPRVVPGGFEGILDGLQILRNMGTSGEKLVCFINTDPHNYS